jgi:hypothetical protein
VGVSSIQAALFGERKRIEAFVTIERVGLFGPFEPVDHQIRERSSDYLVPDFEKIAGGDDVQKDAGGVDAAEGQGDDESRIHGLTDYGGTNGPSPELAAISQEFEPSQRVGVRELTSPEGDETSSKDARYKAEDCGEGLLILPAGSRWQRDNDRSDNVEKCRAEEAQPDGAARGSVPVDLGEYVCKDIGDGKQQHRAANREGADRPSADEKGAKETDLLRDQIRDKQNDHERSGEGVEIFVTASGQPHGAVLDRGERHEFTTSMPCARGVVDPLTVNGDIVSVGDKGAA